MSHIKTSYDNWFLLNLPCSVSLCKRENLINKTLLFLNYCNKFSLIIDTIVFNSKTLKQGFEYFHHITNAYKLRNRFNLIFIFNLVNRYYRLHWSNLIKWKFWNTKDQYQKYWVDFMQLNMSYSMMMSIALQINPLYSFLHSKYYSFFKSAKEIQSLTISYCRLLPSEMKVLFVCATLLLYPLFYCLFTNLIIFNLYPLYLHYLLFSIQFWNIYLHIFLNSILVIDLGMSEFYIKSISYLGYLILNLKSFSINYYF